MKYCPVIESECWNNEDCLVGRYCYIKEIHYKMIENDFLPSIEFTKENVSRKTNGE